MIRQRTDEWHRVRREGITSTDIPALLGVSPWSSEGDVARDKQGVERDEPDAATARRMRLGLALEDVIRAEDEVEHGYRLRRVARFVIHRDIPWAMTSLDFERVGQRCIVETKSSTAQAWSDGLPQNVEAQVRWQMGVARYPRAHVAALRFGSTLACFDLDHDEDVFQAMVRIAADFRRRLAAGGPFAESRASMGRAFPFDNGETLTADAPLTEAVTDLIAVRKSLAALEDKEGALVAAIQQRMGPATSLVGPGFRVTWKRTRDGESIDWRAVAEDYGARVGDPLVAEHTVVKPGSRRFVVKAEESER